MYVGARARALCVCGGGEGGVGINTKFTNEFEPTKMYQCHDYNQCHSLTIPNYKPFLC